MRRTLSRDLALAAVGLGLLAGCAPKLPAGIDEDRLSAAVGRAIGSPSTCVIVADATGKMVWRGGGYITCSRNLPSCEGGANVTAEAVLKASLGKPARFLSCPSATGGANTVGWATGPVPTGEGKSPGGLRYVAVMEGERALPGREVQDRVEGAFEKAGF
jgi:hypothetical protein